MRFMNTIEIDDAASNHEDDPLLGPATVTLQNLRDAADANSDGWCYWPKPCRAAAKLIELIQGDGSYAMRFGPRDDVTAELVRAAYRPLKAFRTRSGLDFTIVEPSA